MVVIQEPPMTAARANARQLVARLTQDWDQLPSLDNCPRRTFVEESFEQITQLINRGYKLRQVHQLLVQQGLQIRLDTFQRYYYTIRAERLSFNGEIPLTPMGLMGTNSAIAPLSIHLPSVSANPFPTSSTPSQTRGDVPQSSKRTTKKAKEKEVSLPASGGAIVAPTTPSQSVTSLEVLDEDEPDVINIDETLDIVEDSDREDITEAIAPVIADTVETVGDSESEETTEAILETASDEEPVTPTPKPTPKQPFRLSKEKRNWMDASDIEHLFEQ